MAPDAQPPPPPPPGQGGVPPKPLWRRLLLPALLVGAFILIPLAINIYRSETRTAEDEYLIDLQVIEPAALDYTDEGLLELGDFICTMARAAADGEMMIDFIVDFLDGPDLTDEDVRVRGAAVDSAAGYLCVDPVAIRNMNEAQNIVDPDRDGARGP